MLPGAQLVRNLLGDISKIVPDLKLPDFRTPSWGKDATTDIPKAVVPDPANAAKDAKQSELKLSGVVEVRGELSGMMAFSNVTGLDIT